ncbi:MAG: 3-isopropylmalate dehydratase small subunit [Candidatus Latescibacterota bacterium]
MADSQIRQVRGRALPLRGANIDTDRIIPARYLRTVTFDDLGGHAFEDDRAPGGHPFDDPRFAGARILLTNANFGCGSSREHAPQALMRWGLRGFLGESFAEIFFGNCVVLGLPCLTASAGDMQRLQEAVEADPQQEMVLDLEGERALLGRTSVSARLPAGVREQFLMGTWDSLGQLLAAGGEVERTAARLPYLTGFADP